MPSGEILWSIKEITQCLRERQLNHFDCNIGVSGARGDGKSTFLFKIFNSFKKEGFVQRKHQVYSQDDVKNLLANQQLSYCWDDEAINSGYKRDFQKAGQTELIKIVTNYRDNFNIYGSALPFFYSLDKALRELIFMHIHIKERGVGVLFLPLEGQIHTQDPWDTKTNQKVEAQENARIQRNPNLKFRYHRFTTFAGYVRFGPLSAKQEEKYKKIKKMKRAETFKKVEQSKDLSMIQKLYNMLIDGKLSREGILQASLLEGLKDSAVMGRLNIMLKDEGKSETVTDLLRKPLREKNSNLSPQISNLVPDL